MKRKLLVLFSISLILLVGCSGSVSREEWDRLSPSMSINDIEEEIGSPKKEITEQRAMLDIVNKDINNTKKMLSTSNFIGTSNELIMPIEDSLKDLVNIYDGIKNGNDIRIYQYDVKNSEGTSELEVYIYKGTLYYYSSMYFN